MSKDLFLLMRQEEIATDNFLPTKKEIQASSKALVQKVIDAGEVDKIQLLSQAIRLKEALTIIETELRGSLPDENFEAYGMKGTYRNGGDMPQFEDDDVYAQLKQDLKDRETLLKAALSAKDSFFDQYGNEVPKVSTKPRKSSLTITF